MQRKSRRRVGDGVITTTGTDTTTGITTTGTDATTGIDTTGIDATTGTDVVAGVGVGAACTAAGER
jgi:hypothetical protein